MQNSRNIVFLVVDRATLLDLAGPYEVFTQAVSCAGGGSPYHLHTLSVNTDTRVKTAGGLVVDCDRHYSEFRGDIDTLFVVGIPNSLHDTLEPPVLDWLREKAAGVRRLCSVCTGTFFLAQAGLLHGKRATTHWEVCDRLEKTYPDIVVEKAPIFVKDGNIYTSAGISAGMDLALALVEEDLGRALALDVAKQLVLFLKRVGNQSQFSSVLSGQNTDYAPVANIQNWLVEHLGEELTVDRMARHAGMSPRNFARVFTRETGVTPAKYVERLRLETACRHLLETRLSHKEIAEMTGFNTADNMRRVFMKNLQITPGSYRLHFRTAT